MEEIAFAPSSRIAIHEGDIKKKTSVACAKDSTMALNVKKESSRLHAQGLPAHPASLFLTSSHLASYKLFQVQHLTVKLPVHYS